MTGSMKAYLVSDIRCPVDRLWLVRMACSLRAFFRSFVAFCLAIVFRVNSFFESVDPRVAGDAIGGTSQSQKKKKKKLFSA